MGKETKIGLGVIGLLLVIFSYVLYYRLTSDNEPLAEAPASAEKSLAADAAAGGDTVASKSKLISGDMSARCAARAIGPALAAKLPKRPPRTASEVAAQVLPTQTEEAAEAPGSGNPFAARSVAVSTQPQSTPEPDPTAPLEADDAQAAAVAAAPLPEENTLRQNSLHGGADNELQPLPTHAAGGGENPLREAASLEGNEPVPAKASARRQRAGEPTLAEVPATATRVAQVSDEQPERTREPFRARIAQSPPDSDDRYGRPRDEDQAEADVTPRRSNDFAARGQQDDFAGRGQRDLPQDPLADRAGQRGVDRDLDRETPTSRPARLGAARPPVARVTVENNRYKVQPNDNYWTISEKVYGSGNFFKAIHEHNRVQHPESDKLSVGDVIEVLPEAELLKRYPGLCPKPRAAAPAKSMAVQTSAHQALGGRVYVVEQGDTLFDIARHELGKASRWAEIYDLNRDALGEDFDFLQPGTELTLPTEKRDAEVITRQNDGGFRR